MFVVKTVPLDDSKPVIMLHEKEISGLITLVRNHLPQWVWRRDRSLFGGYWVDPTLTGNREGECYRIDITTDEEENMIEGFCANGVCDFFHDGFVQDENQRREILNEINFTKSTYRYHNLEQPQILSIMEAHICSLPTPLPYVMIDKVTE